MDNQTFKKVSKVAWIIIFLGFAVLVGFRIDYFNKLDATNAQIEKIHATKLTLADVMGDNLPPDPGTLADATIAGVDANQNGIRDDVELAIFETSKDSTYLRAAKLQKALSMQLILFSNFPNLDLYHEARAFADDSSGCIGQYYAPLHVEASIKNDEEQYLKLREAEEETIDFIYNLVLNTDARKEKYHTIPSKDLKLELFKKRDHSICRYLDDNFK